MLILIFIQKTVFHIKYKVNTRHSNGAFYSCSSFFQKRWTVGELLA